MALKETPFTDMYLGLDGAWLSGVPGTLDPIASPPSDIEEVLSLRSVCEAAWTTNPHRLDFRLRHCDIQYRVSVMMTVKETVFVLRRLADTIRPITELGIPPLMVDLMTKNAMTGLFVVSGPFGQGKTTTAASVVAARLAAHGGVAVTIEDPPEMPLHGKHGEGVCYQTAVEQGGFAHACRQAARWAPSIIFIGEIRDSETALEALRASINGKLVICTTHADNVATTIERIFNLANGDGAAADDVISMLATGLTAVLHQQLVDAGTRRHLKLESLFMTPDNAAGARAIIRHKRFTQLASVIQLQTNRMIQTGSRTTQ